MGAFGISSAAMRRVHGPVTAFALGVGSSVLFVAICWLFSSIEFVGTVYAAFALLVVVPCIAAYTGRPVGS
jgi:multisubunit Na+/H+ antiporter MnhG subunit